MLNMREYLGLMKNVNGPPLASIYSLFLNSFFLNFILRDVSEQGSHIVINILRIVPCILCLS